MEFFLNDLGIVFHTHRVEYPKLLSAQVLPRPLIDLAYHRLEAMKSRIVDFKLIKNICLNSASETMWKIMDPILM